MGIARIGRHLVHHRWRQRRLFPPKTLARIERAIKAGETTHSGQVRFVVEGALDGAPLFRDQPARARALDIFSQLRVWDTEHNNGVLIYLLLAEREIELVADRGLNTRVGAAQWQGMVQHMASAFAQGRFEDGLTQALAEVSVPLVQHFPAQQQPNANLLPDAPVLG